MVHFLKPQPNLKLNPEPQVELKINEAGVLLIYKNWVALILFKPVFNQEPGDQFYSLVKFAYPYEQKRTNLWHQTPRAEICLTPYLPKKQRKEIHKLVQERCTQIKSYLSVKKTWLASDGINWWQAPE